MPTSLPPTEILPYPGDFDVTQRLEKAPTQVIAHVWEEPHTCVVLGKGNKDDLELHHQHIHDDNVQVYRREGGGGSVVLSPGMLIIAVAAHVNDPFGSKRFFRLIQTPVQETIADMGVPGVQQRGISDLAHEGRKILGSSMRRKATLLLYQAVLLVDADRTTFSRYLQHPPKEPDYREGRPHDDFTVTLRELGYQDTVAALQAQLQENLTTRLPLLFGDELVSL